MDIEKKSLDAALYLVSTPIGNLEDITLRAIKILTNADIIACEDTRHSGLLLKHLQINAKQLVSYYEQNEKQRAEELSNQIQLGKSVALITDAGTPGISDPGYRLVSLCIEKDLKVYPIPGASALIAALSASGLSVNEFKFFGFPPQKKGRASFINRFCKTDCTAILYESPYRVQRLLDEISKECSSDRKIVVARELTKFYEEFIRGTIEEVNLEFKTKQNIKGEFVVLLEGIKV